jgi:hypothetical protein
MRQKCQPFFCSVRNVISDDKTMMSYGEDTLNHVHLPLHRPCLEGSSDLHDQHDDMAYLLGSAKRTGRTGYIHHSGPIHTGADGANKSPCIAILLRLGSLVCDKNVIDHSLGRLAGRLTARKRPCRFTLPMLPMHMQTRQVFSSAYLHTIRRCCCAFTMRN